MSEEGGIWRTIGGRRVFIKDGEDLATAMKNSGKFEKKKDNRLDLYPAIEKEAIKIAEEKGKFNAYDYIESQRMAYSIDKEEEKKLKTKIDEIYKSRSK